MYTIKKKILHSEVDNNHKLKILPLINIIQDIEGEHIDSLKDFSNYMFNNNIGIFLSYRQINIIDLPKLNNEIKLVTYPYETNSYFGLRNTIIYKNEKPIITSYAIGAFTNLIKIKLDRIPQEITNTIPHSSKYDMDYYPRKINYDKNNLNFVSTKIVSKTHIDSYNHLNNAFYISFTYDLLPDDYKFNIIRAEYKRPNKIHNELKIFNQKTNNSIIYIIKTKDDEESCIIEYLNK